MLQIKILDENFCAAFEQMLPQRFSDKMKSVSILRNFRLD